MEQVIKKGKFIALLRNGNYDVYHKERYLFTISAQSALIVESSEILKEISKQFKQN